MKWNNRNLRAPGNYNINPSKKTIDYAQALKPYGEGNRGKVWIPVKQIIMDVEQDEAVPVSPTPTPSITPTSTLTPTPSITPTLTNTPTNTITPSITPTLTTSPTPTQTGTPTPTLTNTPTNTGTPTPTPSSTLPASGTSQANAYLSAVITNGGTGLTPTISAATRTLFTSLVSNGLYSKMLAMYPLIGGVANSAKLNAVNLGTYDITWNGGMSFNFTGATSNGTNGFGDTGIIFSALTSYFTNGSFGVYCNTAFPGTTTCPMGAGPSAVSRAMLFGAGGGFLLDWGSDPNPGGYGRTAISSTPTGLYICSSSGTSINRVLVNGSTSYSNSVGIVKSTPPNNMYLFKREDGYVYPGTETFAFVASALTLAEMTTLSTIINTYQTSLGRNRY